MNTTHQSGRAGAPFAFVAALTFLSFLFASTVLAPTASADHQWGTRHWYRASSSPAAVVQIADRTDIHPFPVTTATWAWDNPLSEVSLVYKWWNCDFAAKCVTVWEEPQINGVLGVTSAPYDSNGHIIYSHIRLDPNQNDNDHKKIWVSTHEIGHALGLNHRADTNTSVMYPYAYESNGAANSTTPDAHDVGMVDSIHAHTH
ncbi:matrixin family metalloprotease [Nocardia halotolerans]|uniref:Matrixin family metalloprotease n=1 Tax=Nocardia halotolerans TaxID=1755878 RepID=A0ABV8VB70_9NOCA